MSWDRLNILSLEVRSRDGRTHSTSCIEYSHYCTDNPYYTFALLAQSPLLKNSTLDYAFFCTPGKIHPRQQRIH